MMADIRGDFNSYIIEISYYHPVAIDILITFPADNISFSHALFQVDYEQALYQQRFAW